MLLALPATEPDLIRHWTLGPAEIVAIQRRRRDRNRLGFALQLCSLRYPGRLSRPGEVIPGPALRYVAHQLDAGSGRRRRVRRPLPDPLRAARGLARVVRVTALGRPQRR